MLVWIIQINQPFSCQMKMHQLMHDDNHQRVYISQKWKLTQSTYKKVNRFFLNLLYWAGALLTARTVLPFLCSHYKNAAFLIFHNLEDFVCMWSVNIIAGTVFPKLGNKKFRFFFPTCDQFFIKVFIHNYFKLNLYLAMN